MPSKYSRLEAKKYAINREERTFQRPLDINGNYQKASEYYGESVFHYLTAPGIPESIKEELLAVSNSGTRLKKEHADIVAKAVTEWAVTKGATHFCHWFQPLTGSTAEKHDAFLDLDGETPIEKLSAGQLMQGEPDASSFPNGGSRSTFEARGYTSWDLSSPMFLVDSVNGKALCIPTAFVSYHGDALDMKTPLLRSITNLNEVATKFMNMIGFTETNKVTVTCGAEQEYFLVDKAYYFSRPDLVMTGRTLLGSLSHKNQQLDDHYFGRIPERVLSCMEEIDYELHRLGVPAKTRHNEVAPGQFELAQIFREANVSADNNQLVMAIIRDVAEKHNFVALLHEKPFAGVNGSGKHINWSLATDDGMNLLEPGTKPEKNLKFLAVTSIVIEAVHRRAKLLRMAIASQGNDHRLGANEAPPSIISVFTGSNLEKIFESIKNGETITEEGKVVLDLGANQLANLMMDNTDRNRTSPFAFTGNKFELRAVGSWANCAGPMTTLNTIIAKQLKDFKVEVDKLIDTKNLKKDEAVFNVLREYIKASKKIRFEGNGYGIEWEKEAAKRGLSNHKTTPEALKAKISKKSIALFKEMNVMSNIEVEARHEIELEEYILRIQIEGRVLGDISRNHVIPTAIKYQNTLIENVSGLKTIFGDDFKKHAKEQIDLIEKISHHIAEINSKVEEMIEQRKKANKLAGQKSADAYCNKVKPYFEEIRYHCDKLEMMVDDELWPLAKYRELLFTK